MDATLRRASPFPDDVYERARLLLENDA
jgi:hypothetical protein